MIDLINFYKNKTRQQLELIAPQWAYGKNISKLSDDYLNLLNSEFKIFLSDPFDLVKNADFKEVNTDILFIGDSKYDFRIARILHRWKHHDVVDPPLIGLGTPSDNNKIVFGDGRHRTKLAYHLKQKQMPVLITNQDEQRIKKIIKLTLIHNMSWLDLGQRIMGLKDK